VLAVALLAAVTSVVLSVTGGGWILAQAANPAHTAIVIEPA
jgi:hypothetical protein